MPRLHLLAALLIALGSAPVVAATGLPGDDLSFLSYEGTAIDPKRETVLYRESHYVRMEHGTARDRLVLYRCPDGQPFARKRVETRFGTPWLPAFGLEDQRLGYVEGLRGDGDTLEVYVREGWDAALQRDTIRDAPVALVADAGFDAFVRDHWDELLAGQTVRLYFLVPSRLDYLAFKVRKVGEETLEGRKAQRFRLSLGGLLGLFVSGIDVVYDDETRVLMQYQGLTNVRDPQGDNYVARIDFPLAARKLEATPAAFDAARELPLVASCSG
jgi:hypothetical protein